MTVLEQYHRHIIRIRLKAHCLKSSLTHKERRGIAYYTAAAQTVQAFFDAPTPAWVNAPGKFVRL
jgi:hypothetical protein